jgi:hypothetical protein
MRRKSEQPGPIRVRGASFPSAALGYCLSHVIFIVVVYLALILHQAMLENILKDKTFPMLEMGQASMD